MAGPSYVLPMDPGSVEPEEGGPPVDRIVRGEPRTRTWTVDSTPDGQLHTGLWEASPGAWRVNYDEWEFCTILEGVSILREDGVETPRVLRPGDSVIIHPGFSGIWDVVETTRKIFVVRLAA